MEIVTTSLFLKEKEYIFWYKLLLILHFNLVSIGNLEYKLGQTVFSIFEW